MDVSLVVIFNECDVPWMRQEGRHGERDGGRMSVPPKSLKGWW